MKRYCSEFWRDQSGATAIEYGMVAGMISLGIIPLLMGISGEVVSMYQSVLDAFGFARGGGP